MCYNRAFKGQSTHLLTSNCEGVSNKNIKLRFFKSGDNIQKTEGGPDSTVSNNQFS